jgi:hypothetical protein
MRCFGPSFKFSLTRILLSYQCFKTTPKRNSIFYLVYQMVAIFLVSFQILINLLFLSHHRFRINSKFIAIFYYFVIQMVLVFQDLHKFRLNFFSSCFSNYSQYFTNIFGFRSISYIFLSLMFAIVRKKFDIQLIFWFFPIFSILLPLFRVRRIHICY